MLAEGPNLSGVSGRPSADPENITNQITTQYKTKITKDYCSTLGET